MYISILLVQGHFVYLTSDLITLSTHNMLVVFDFIHIIMYVLTSIIIQDCSELPYFLSLAHKIDF